jgi:hypothetical protein
MAARRVLGFGLLALLACASACESSTASDVVADAAPPDADVDGRDDGCGGLKTIFEQTGALVQQAASGCTTTDDCTFVAGDVPPCIEGCPTAVLKTNADGFRASLAALSASCPAGCESAASCGGGTLVCRAGFCDVDFNSGGSCPGPPTTKADLDQADGAPGWSPPQPRQTTACSPADIQRFSTNASTPSLASWNDVVDGLPASCAQCLLSRETDASWQLIVADATGKNGFVNWGACYADAPHGSIGCGQAAQYLEFCLDISCLGCATQADVDACKTSKAVTNGCDGAFGPFLESSCPQEYAQELSDQCGQLTNAAAMLCGDGTLPDGGKLTE